MCAICQLPTTHGVERIIIANYIDPGSGFVVQSFFPAVLAFLSSILAGSLFFFRRFFKFFFKKKVFIAIGILVIIIGIITVMTKGQNTTTKRVVVLGFDGLDAKMVEEWMDVGLLPNFKSLKEKGYYSPLQTTVPPQSPVAWASFTTGKDPSKHKIYDFITRDPKTYSLDLSFSNTNKWKEAPFWKNLSDRGIHTTILFLPNTYPPSELNGEMLSGMGTPDVLGTQGTFTLFTTKEYPEFKDRRGKLIQVENSDEIQSNLEGPKYSSLNDKKTVQTPIKIIRNNKSVLITINNKKITLKEKEFSEWVPVEFKIDFLTKIHGITRFYLKEAGKDLELYSSPINFDPKNPMYPVSYPKSYSKQIAQTYGYYSTLGLPRDTWALEQDVFDEKAFMRQSDSIIAEREAIYFGELKKFESGVFFGYFGFTDIVSHMYWRASVDPENRYSSAIQDAYKKADAIVGKTLKTLKKDDTLVILSDHGFGPFEYEMNVNTWLKENGYLVLKDDVMVGRELFEDVDWSKTKAYAAGYNGIYLNIKGREREGIVDKKESQSIADEIKAKLLALKNPFTNTSIMKKMYHRKELDIADDDLNAPDLFLGYYKGIRSSWDTAVGAAPREAIKTRTGKWSGDHLFDPTEVPGVLFVNKKVQIDPQIEHVMSKVITLVSEK